MYGTALPEVRGLLSGLFPLRAAAVSCPLNLCGFSDLPSEQLTFSKTYRLLWTRLYSPPRRPVRLFLVRESLQMDGLRTAAGDTVFTSSAVGCSFSAQRISGSPAGLDQVRGGRPTRWGVELPLPETLHWKLQWAGGWEGEVGDKGSGAKVQAAALGGMGKGQAPAGPWTGQGEPRQVEGHGGSGVRTQFPSLRHELCLAAGVQKQQHQSGGSPVGAELRRPGQCRDRKFQ